MKKLIVLGVFISLFSFQINAQSVETGVLPSITSAEGQFTEWKKVEFTASGQNVSYEYRIAFMKRKALACNYEVQLKNTSGQKLSIKLTTHYYDKLVKDRFGDTFKESLKAEKDISFAIITQGAKEDKEKKDQPDIERCMSCDFSYEIHVDLDQ